MSKQRTKQRTNTDPYDGVFALKIALYVILGTLWLKLSNDQTIFPIPIGLIIGMVLASHEHFKLDRKIDYAVLLIAALVGFWAPFGIYISF